VPRGSKIFATFERVFSARGAAAYPSPLPLFLEVLILEDLERDFSEVLIPVGLKSFRINMIRGFLEVLILKGLKSDFSEVLIPEELRREECEIKGFLRNVLRRGSVGNTRREAAGRPRPSVGGFTGDADLRFTRPV
jgi:hypothetical protein